MSMPNLVGARNREPFRRRRAAGASAPGPRPPCRSKLSGPTEWRRSRADNTGNWLVLVEPKEFTPEDFA